jgi:hypothetical protein
MPANARTSSAISLSSSIGARANASCSASVRRSPIISMPLRVTSDLCVAATATLPEPDLSFAFFASGIR